LSSEETELFTFDFVLPQSTPTSPLRSCPNSCVIIFFSALSGFGYVEPGSTSSSSSNPIQPPAGAFNPGQPVHDNLLNSGAAAGLNPIEEEKVIKMKQLEEQWARQKRPKDGAWMRSNRNQREVRRKPLADSRFQRQREQGGRE